MPRLLQMTWSSKALQEMISVCYKYSCLRRYQYNTGKCAVVTFNEYIEAWIQTQFSARGVSNDAIYEKEEYNHLGLICNE